MDQAKRVAKNTGFLYARMAITVFISLYTTRLILAALGATDFGIFNLVAGAIAMLAFLNSAMALATQRFMSYAEGKGDFDAQVGIFNVSIGLHLIIAVLVVLFMEGAGYFLFDGILEIPENRLYAAKFIFQCMVLSTFIGIISVPYDAVINAHENMFLVAILGIVEALIKLAIALYVTTTGFDKLISYGLLMAVMTIILLIIRRVYCHLKYEEVKINVRKYYSKALFKEMGNFAGWTFLGSSTSIISFYGQGLVLNMFFGPRVNAAHGISNQVSGQLGAFSTTMLKALNPVIAKSEGAGNRATMLKITEMGSKVSFFLLLILYVPVLIEMPYIFNLWLKEVPEYTIIFCRLLLIKNLIQQLFVSVDTSIRAVGNIRGFQISSAIASIFPLLICAGLFTIELPAYYLYIVFMLHAVINAYIILYFANKHCDLQYKPFMQNVVVRCFTTFILMAGCSLIPLFFMDEGFIRLITIGVLSFITYILFIWNIGFGKKEKEWIMPLLLSFISTIKNKIFRK
ncbi:hypothetical protein M601_015935 [Cellulophaga baltica 4]|nr:hypothetical protein M601_015935 [Cellulophaga baltica 4]